MTLQLPFTSTRLLAPMEGVTEPAFRGLVLATNGAGHLGGTFTDFLRVSSNLPRRSVFRRHWNPAPGTPSDGRPVGFQIMGCDPELMACCAERAAEVGAPLVDINFGCPARGALRGQAGAALLDDPPRIESIVASMRRALPRTPLSAKIRAGGDHDRLLEDLARAVEAGGADLLTVHARTRREGYRAAADWTRLERAVQSVSIPVCGNGGILCTDDFERLMEATGCAYAMVGRAALGNPWVFSGRTPPAAEQAHFLLAYAQALADQGGAAPRGQVARIKQLLAHWNPGSLVSSDPDHPNSRGAWLGEQDPVTFLKRLRDVQDWPSREPLA